jgi:AraC-like DNA-binding protein
MDTQPTTSATTLRLFTEALEALRVDWRAILRSCDIDPAQLADPEARIPQDRFQHVWIAAQEWTGDPCIGLHAGVRIHAHAVNLFGYLMLSSTTLGDGLRRVAHYQRVLIAVPWVAIDDSGVGVRVRVGTEHGDSEFRAIHAEYVAALVLQILGWVSETEIEPSEARFEHEPRGELSEYRRLLRCPVRFSADRNELVLDARTLDRPSIHADDALARVHEEFAHRLLASEEEATLTRRVRRALAEHLESGAVDLASVARQLGLSARSLQRRLAEERTSFREILENLRRELASEHLERHATPIAAVAYLTGFSEVSAFTRAVRRWFGLTPARLRREASRRGASPPSD